MISEVYEQEWLHADCVAEDSNRVTWRNGIVGEPCDRVNMKTTRVILSLNIFSIHYFNKHLFCSCDENKSLDLMTWYSSVYSINVACRDDVCIFPLFRWWRTTWIHRGVHCAWKPASCAAATMTASSGFVSNVSLNDGAFHSVLFTVHAKHQSSYYFVLNIYLLEMNWISFSAESAGVPIRMFSDTILGAWPQ